MPTTPNQPAKTASQENSSQAEGKLPPPELKSLVAHRLTLVGYFGLILLIPIWNFYWYPSGLISAKILTIFWLIPLAFPLPGLLKGKAYTHAWSGFIAVIYLCHALASYVTAPKEWPAITLELLLAACFLGGATYFAKWRGEQLGLQLPKNKS